MPTRPLFLLLVLWSVAMISWAQTPPIEPIVAIPYWLEEEYLEEDMLHEWSDTRPQKDGAPSSYPFIDLNQATAEQLTTLLALTPRQIASLERFKAGHGGYLRSLSDLKLLRYWDAQTIQRISTLVYVGEPAPHERSLFRPGRGRIALAISSPLFREKEQAVLGPPFQLRLRTEYHRPGAYSFGLLVDKGRGEPFFDQHIRTFDRYSMHAALWHPIRFVEQLVVGDYRAGWGQGLILNNGWLRGVAAQSESPFRASFLTPTLSAGQQNTLRGAASILRFGEIEVSGLFSFRRLDATVSPRHMVTAFPEDKPHDKAPALSQRHQLREYTYGGRLAWHIPRFTLGLNALRTDWGKGQLTKIPGHPPFPNGLRSHVANYSLDFLFRTLSGAFSSKGEFALDHALHPAAAASLIYRGEDGIKGFLAARYLSSHYVSRLGNSLSHRPYPTNEYGLFVKVTAPLYTHLSGTGYLDLYSAVAPESRQQRLVQGIVFAGRLLWEPHTQHRGAMILTCRGESGSLRSLRGQLRYGCRLREYWHLALYAQAKVARQVSQAPLAKGYMAAAEISLLPSREQKQRYTFTVAAYESEHFAARHYVNLPRVRYTTSSSMLYGRGLLAQIYAQLAVKRWQLAGSLLANAALATQRTATQRPPGWEGALLLSYLF